jgi:hypothetical protein
MGYTFHYNGYNINLVDTPGFNDTNKSETEVLQDIATWLKHSYEGDTRLNGVIYLHSLVNVRMEGSALRNLKMFRQLCGNEPLKNVILATTFWGEVNREVAEKREEELRTTPEFWGSMLSRGSTMKRLTERRSAFDIVSTLLQKAPVTLKIQRELVEEDKSLIDTAAGQTVNEELIRLAEKHAEELSKIQQEMQEALKDHDEEMQQILDEQQRKLDKELAKVHRQQEQLRYDRRAEKRRMENNFEARIRDMQLEMERQAKVRELSFDQAVALVRANEGKIRVEERELLERKIAELSQSPALAEDGGGGDSPGAPKKGRKAKGTSRFLFGALKVIFPVTTAALLGVPIPSPFGSGETITNFFGGMFGKSGEQPVDPAQEPAEYGE